MKYSLEQKMDIGRQMYMHEITYKEAMDRYNISESCTHKYMTDYKKSKWYPPQAIRQQEGFVSFATIIICFP